MKKSVFLHIQKTAGNTLHQIFYNNRKGYVALDYRNGRNINPSLLRRVQKLYPFKITDIGGHHIDCTAKNAYWGEDQYTFTILRDPVARYISYYNHLKYKHKVDITFDAFLMVADQYNLQTKVIGNTNKSEDAIDVLDQNFDFVGIVEKMKHTLAILAQDLKLDINQKALNIATEDSINWNDLTTQQQSKVTQNNIEDLKLYAYACGRFDKELALRAVSKSPKVSPFRKKVGVLLKKVSISWVNRVILR